MDASTHYMYSRRADIDQQVDAMQQRIVAERRSVIGVMAARREAAEVTAPWHQAQYNKIDDEAVAQWGIDC